MAGAIAQALREVGVRRVYGLPGGENVELLEALRRCGMDFVLVHNESSALYMAAAAARLERRPGVCLTTLGPGLANAIAGLGHAWLDRAPLLLLTAQIPAALVGRHTHQLIDQQALTRPLTKAGRALRPGDDARAIVHQLLRAAVSDRPGPVHLQLSRAVAAGPAARVARPQPFRWPQPASPDLADMQRAAELWRAAKRPLLLVGLGLDAQNCHAPLLALAEASHAPLITTPKVKGAIPASHPLAAGAIGLTRADPAYQLLDEADCLLALGLDAVELVRPWQTGEVHTPLPQLEEEKNTPAAASVLKAPLPSGEGEKDTPATTSALKVPLPSGEGEKDTPAAASALKAPLPEGLPSQTGKGSRRKRERAPAASGTGFGVRAAPLIWLAPWANEDPRLPAAASFTGHMTPVLQQLTKVSGTADPSWGAPRVARFHKMLAQRRFPAPAPGRMSPRALLTALRRAAPPATPLTVDVGTHKIFASLEWPDAQPRRFFLSNGLSCMGYGLPAAISASLALGQAPALCITGDAGMTMVLGELELITRLGAPVVTVVMNDSALDLIRLAQQRAGAQVWGTEFGNPDFAQIAAAYGLPALRSADVAECEDAVREALRTRQPLLVDALIDPACYALPTES